jgi:hypothetical protein
MTFGNAFSQAPNAPTNLVVSPINTGGMIQFIAPSNIGGSAITNYEYSTDDGASWTTPSPAVTESPLIINSGLTNCTSYQVKIRAVNSSGSGVASVAENLTPRPSAAPGSVWTLETAAENNSWTGITYGNGLFVAVSESGTNRIMTSPDGITWTARTAPEANAWSSITYGNGLFVAVSISGTNQVMTSPDGINWTARTVPVGEWYSVTYGNGLYVAVSNLDSGNQVITSQDGVNWTVKTTPENNGWASVTYGNGIFVAVASNSNGAYAIITSQDGNTWFGRSSSIALNYVAYGNGLFVGGNTFAYSVSTNGINWTATSVASGSNLYPIGYGNGLFVALDKSTTITNKIKTGFSGNFWTTIDYVDSNSWKAITYGNGIFVGVASTGSKRVLRSTYAIAPEIPTISSIAPRNNGVRISIAPSSSVSYYAYSIDNGFNWINSYPSINSNEVILDINALTNNVSYPLQLKAINDGGASCPTSVIDITPASGTIPDAPTNLTVNSFDTGSSIEFKAPNNDGGSYITNYEYSLDNGTTWITPSPTIKESPITISGSLTNCSSYQMKLRAVNEYGSGTASETSVLSPKTSTNPGNTWTKRTASENNTWSGIAYGNGVYVAVASSGTNRVMSSNDGIIWTPRMAAVANSWSAVCFGNGLFVAVAVDGMTRVMTSPDGINWTARKAAKSNAWKNVTYGNGLFVAVASSGTSSRVMTSPNGINWTARTAFDSNYNSVTYGNGVFVAVASSGTSRVITSTDGVTWTARTASQANIWNSVTYGNGLFVAVASSGPNRIMTSTNGINWVNRTATEANSWNSITYGNGLFVAVASTGTNRMMTSTNGTNWTAKSIDANSWSSVIYGNVSFVAVAGTGTNSVITSTYSLSPEAPIITSTSISNAIATVSFTQSALLNDATISNYEYSIDNGTSWTALSPAATTSPLSISGLPETTSSMMLRAVNSVGVSCPSNNFSLCTPTYSTETISICSSYTWAENGQTYTTSGTYTSTIGCDTITLELTIIPSITSTTTISACDSYTWAENGQTYTTSGTYTSTTGCDTKTLELTITPSSSSTSDVTACDSYTWAANGQTYTTSGTYTSTTDCDTITLELTITPSSSSTSNVTACESYTWAENGQTYTTSGTYTSTIGCDSKTLELTIATPSATGMISGATFVAMGTNSTTLTVSNNIGSIQWQMANSISGPYSDIIGATTASYLATNLTSTSYYRVQVTNGSCNSATSLPATITVGVSGDTTTLIDSLCGNTIESMSTTISCYPVNGATLYKFKITTLSTNASRYYSTTTNNFSLSKLLGLNYNTAYSISISAKIGYSFKSFGAECIITTPYAITKIRDSQCGNTLTNINSTIYTAKTFSGTTGYRFEVTNGNNTYTYESLNSYFRLSQLNSAVLYNSTYAIRVSVNLNGIWHPFGETCLVSTPPVPLTQLKTTQCGITLSTNNDNVLYANPVVVAQLYRFEISNASNVYYYETTSSMARTFRLTQVQGLTIQNGATYSIRVAIMANGVWQPYGPSCSVTASGIPSEIVKTIPEINNSSNFNVFAYPNPFTENFKIDLKSSNEDKVIILVYDMLGKLIEAKSINTIDYISEDLGSAYPVGVYNVIVTQGENVKALRVIKR